MLSYIGGKSKIGKWIVPFYPKDIETYVRGDQFHSVSGVRCGKHGS